MQAFWFSCAALLILSSCTKNGQGDTTIVLKRSKGEALAQVGSVTLTVEEMKTDFLERQGQFKGAANLNNDKARNDYIENQVVQEAMFQEALNAGYFDHSDVRRDVKKIVVQRLMRDKLENAQTTYEPSEEQIKEHYEKNPNFYNREEGVKVAYILIPFGENKAKSKEIATALHKDAVLKVKNANIKAFARIAMENSSKIGQLNNVSVETNETDYLDKKSYEARFGPNSFEAIKSLELTGQISPLITTDKNFAVVMKTGFRKQLNETLEEAKPKIVKRLAYENRGEVYKKYLEDLRKKYDIKIFKEHLAKLSEGVEPPSTAKKELQANPLGQAQAPETKPATPSAAQKAGAEVAQEN